MDVHEIRARFHERKTIKQLRQRDDDVDLTTALQHPYLADARLSGFEDPQSKALTVAIHALEKCGAPSIVPILDVLLQLKGKPYSLHNHFPFAPLFRTRMPKITTVKSGRQVSKSTSLAAQGVGLSVCNAYFTTLFVTPLYEQIRRFSHNYVRPFIESSKFRDILLAEGSTNSVLQRSFANSSSMIFSFAGLDAERTRGVPADKNVIDEVQNIDIKLLPIIHETMSGSPWSLIQYTGTPLTFDNTLHRLFQDSSQAEWVIQCRSCNYWNVPCLEGDLLQMIGPWHRNISEKCPGTVCAKCRKPISPRWGFWWHAFGDRRWSHAGYHVPQILLPMHYADPGKWGLLLDKQAGKGNTPLYVFFNEVCGEAYDTGAKLVTETDLRRAARLPWHNIVDEAKPHIRDYTYRVCAVDWGGGGVSNEGKADEAFTSYTSIAVLGATAGGKFDLLYGYRSQHPHDHIREAKLVIAIMSKFHCHMIAHDYTGAGTVRETVLKQAGVPLDRIIPIAYTGPMVGPFFAFKAARPRHPRAHYLCDRSRSLVFTCQMLKSGALSTFKYDYNSAGDPGLLHDFLALIEEKKESFSSRDSYRILRDPSSPDDFAHAVNIGCMTLMAMLGYIPDLAALENVELPEGKDDHLGAKHQVKQSV